MFKNAIIYTVTPGFKFNPEYLGRRPARACSAFEQRTDGFVNPCDHSGLVHDISGMQVICWETEDKILPGSVVTDHVNECIDNIEDEQGRKVGRKEARDIKERVIEDLLPKAFVQHRRTFAALTDKYLIINTSSQARADDLLLSLNKALDAMPFRPMNTVIAPLSAMTGWVAANDAPAGFSLDDILELRSASEQSASIRYTNHDIGGDEVANHIANGKIAIKLGMTFNDRVSFVVDDKLHIKRIAFLDFEREEEDEDPQSVFDADMTLAVAEITAVIDSLAEEMGGFVKPESDLLEAA
jgi:recombination associated protein RdgC